jgi:hypothetical protein
MRERLNSNPVAQLALVGVLIVAVGFLFVTRMGGGGSEEAATTTPTQATVSVAGTDVTGTATGATPGAAVDAAVADATAQVGAGATAGVVAGSVPAPPLPDAVTSAYEAGDTVVLLVVHDDGIDDRLVTQSVKQLEGDPGLALFVVPAAQVSRYAAITLGVDVDRVPALVILRPKRLSGGTPQASVTYGFQTSQGIVQAVRDASYNGPDATYHPD